MIYLAGSLSSGYTLITTILFICCIRTEKPKKSALAAASVICIVISLAMAWCSAQETHFYDGVALLVYIARWFIVITVALGGFRWIYLYTAILYEFIFPTFIYIFATVPEYTGLMPDYVAESITLTVLNTISLILLYIFREKIVFWVRSIIKILPKHFFVFVLLAAFCLCGLTTLNKYPTVTAAETHSTINLILVILTIVMTWMIPSLLINLISNQNFRNTSTLLQKQVEIQLQHYNKQEKLNSEIRSFRHDYINHLCSIRSLIQGGENNGAITYIDKLLDTKHSTQTSFSTGNRLADAILTDKADILPAGIDIVFHGMIPPTLDNLHLCVILTNALDNAAEACSKLSSEGTISITAQEHQGYFVMTMTNPTTDDRVYSDIPATSKADGKHHGMGLINIHNAVEAYDGQMHIHCEDHLFELSVTLKMQTK